MTSVLIQHLITTTLLASLVWVVCRLAKPAPAARHILWSLVILKLVIPPMGHVGIEMPFAPSAITTSEPTASITPPTQSTPVEVATAATIEPTFNSPTSAVELTPTPSATSTISTTDPLSPTPAPALPATPIHWTTLAIAAWFCGAVGVALLQLIRWQRFTAQTSVSANTPAWLHGEAAAVAKRLGCTPVPVTVCNRLSTPAVAGVSSPRILVPSALLERLPRERWRALLAHEYAHLKRRDTWWRALELACGIVWFWNPVFWFARKQARNAAEHACDAWVVWAMPDQRRAYADSLVDVSEWASSPNLPATAIGMSAASRAKLEARLTSIVLGSTTHRVSKTAIAAGALFVLAALPGWAIEARQHDIAPEVPQRASHPSVERTRVAQAEDRIPAATPPASDSAGSALTVALSEPVSIEFDDENLQTILEFISGYTEVNIVLDHSVVAAPLARASSSEMEVVHVGPHWFKQPRQELLGSKAWPKTQAADGMVGPASFEASSAKEVLDRLLPDAGMTYAITPDCIWITVAKPQFEIVDPDLKPESWAWHPAKTRNYQQSDAISPIFSAFNSAPGAPTMATIDIEERHITQVVADLYTMFAPPVRSDGKIAGFELPPIVVDAVAIEPPRDSPFPTSYLVEANSARVANAARDLNAPSFKGGHSSAAVTSGIVPYIKLDNVPLKGALTALLRPLSLTYATGPGYIYVSSPERVAAFDFTDRPVPPDQTEIASAMDDLVSIEFAQENVDTILEFISGYLNVNIVLDFRAVVPEVLSEYTAAGAKPVTNGMVPFIKVENLDLADTLKVLLTPLGLDYSVGPGFIWVSSPEFLAQDARMASNTPARAPHAARAPSPAAAPVAPAEPVAMAAVEPRPEPRPAAVVEPRPATVTRPAKTPGPVVDGYTFRRITRWEDSDARVEVEFGDGRVKWYEIGAAFGPIGIADIDVVANQVVINRNGAFEVVQLAWPIASAPPVPAVKRTGQNASRWMWMDIPYGNVKFGPIARWENSDPRLQVEFPTGQRKWLEVGDAIGNARIGGINIIANQVTVRTPENESRTFDLPRPIQVSDNAIPNATRKPMNVEGRTWTPVESGGIIIGRIARWEDSGDARVEVELPGGEHKWLEAGQSAAGVSIENIDVVKNRVVIHHNGAEKIVQLPWAASKSEAPSAPRTNPRDSADVGVGDQRWIDYLGDWSRPQ